MKISGIQKLSMVDFNTHVSCTLFTSGCNFACPFCHNAGLVQNNEEEILQQDIFDFLYKRRNMLDGVVISGGEPTLHADLPEFIARIKKLGFLIKLDTNGTNPEMVKYLVENHLVDYIAMDIKNSIDGYPKTIGRPIIFDKIKTSIDYIMSCGIDYEFRTTLVKEFHNAEEIKKIADLIPNAKRYFLQRFIDSGNCISANLHEISREDAENFIEILKAKIPSTTLRGY